MAELVITKLRPLSTGQYRIEVVLDDSVAHPLYFRAILEQTPDGMTETEWLNSERDRLRPLIQAQHDQVAATEGSALPGEGDPL